MLTGAKVALTALRKEDAEVLFRWINDPATARFNAPFAPVHEPAHLVWFDRTTADPSRVIFGIRELATKRLVGSMQLIDIHPVHRSAELTIRIGDEQDRGQGYGTDALRLAISFAFGDRNLQRISLRVFADNTKAVRAYEKAGFQREGLYQRAAFINGQWLDVVSMAILAPLSP